MPSLGHEVALEFSYSLLTICGKFLFMTSMRFAPCLELIVPIVLMKSTILKTNRMGFF